MLAPQSRISCCRAPRLRIPRRSVPRACFYWPVLSQMPAKAPSDLSPAVVCTFPDIPEDSGIGTGTTIFVGAHNPTNRYDVDDPATTLRGGGRIFNIEFSPAGKTGKSFPLLWPGSDERNTHHSAKADGDLGQHCVAHYEGRSERTISNIEFIPSWGNWASVY